MGLKKSNEKCQELVKLALTNHEITRDDDLLLCFFVWKYQGLRGKISVNELIGLKLFKPESISRARRIIQNEFLELVGETKKKRMERAEDLRVYYGSKEWNRRWV